MDALSFAQIHCFFKAVAPTRTIHCKRSCNFQSRPRVSMKYGELALAHQVFDEISPSDTFAWNSLIQTHLSNKDPHNVLLIYTQMLLRGVRPDKHTLPRIVAASRLSGNLFIGKQLHGQALKLHFLSDPYVITALIEMYGRLDSAEAAKVVFDNSPRKNSVSWTILAKLYLMEDKPNLAIELFRQMVDCRAEIDPVVIATAAGACGLLKSLHMGINVHEIAKKCGLESDVLVSNSLLNMYIDCGSIGDARAIFDRMSSKDIISWTEMIRGYVKNGGFNEGLKLFRQMNLDGIKPDSLSISSVLPACARMAAHKLGKEIHGYLLRNGIDMNLTVENAIMDMYVKSGFIEYASKVFEGMKDKDIISWTVMILGCSLHGQGELGVDLFCKMEKESSTEIDQFTYAAVLHACRTACMVEQGKFYFNCIRAPEVSHCALLVALLARAGLFDEARIFIAERQIERHTLVLRALLDGCRIHRQSNLGKRIIEQLCDLEPLNAENYVLLENWYADSRKWEMVDKFRGTIRDMGLKPKKAYSWIEFQSKVHVFGTGDVSHPRSERIYWELQSLTKKMKDKQLQPISDFSLHDVDEERECIQIGHSEMLALSFGLITTQAGATIRVTKNLRVCRNCHDSAKIISKIVEREIILKDQNCFHHFKDGDCSCGDLW